MVFPFLTHWKPSQTSLGPKVPAERAPTWPVGHQVLVVVGQRVVFADALPLVVFVPDLLPADPLAPLLLFAVERLRGVAGQVDADPPLFLLFLFSASQGPTF
jgi:hypothetical protein